LRVLAAIPCYNEAVTIGSVALLARRHVDEVLVVDDGSSDATTAIAKAAGAQLIRHDKNKGKGGAGRGKNWLLQGYVKDELVSKQKRMNGEYFFKELGLILL
jgi:cellulose synthase/poly-beta-1,6-N-acetylglucosamine synthase-like glycosyltransferase